MKSQPESKNTRKAAFVTSYKKDLYVQTSGQKYPPHKHGTLPSLTTLSYLLQSSPSELLQYIGLWPIVIIHGRWVRFSGDAASYDKKQQQQNRGTYFGEKM